MSLQRRNTLRCKNHKRKKCNGWVEPRAIGYFTECGKCLEEKYSKEQQK